MSSPRITVVAAALSAALSVALAGCRAASATPSARATEAALADGTYRAVFGAGYAPADEARILAVTAHLDRAAGRLVLTLADGSRRSLAFAPRDRARWHPDCFTGAGGPPSSVLGEVADLSPAPLRLESLTLETPIVYAKCSPRRMVLAGAVGDAAPFLVLDLQ
jgi:hypothetical protein